MMIYQIPVTELDKYVGLLTTEQADALRGQTFLRDSYFNPIQDVYERWVISAEEIAYCGNPLFLWVKELEMVPYEPKPAPPLFGETSQRGMIE